MKKKSEKEILLSSSVKAGVCLETERGVDWEEKGGRLGRACTARHPRPSWETEPVTAELVMAEQHKAGKSDYFLFHKKYALPCMSLIKCFTDQ